MTTEYAVPDFASGRKCNAELTHLTSESNVSEALRMYQNEHA